MGSASSWEQKSRMVWSVYRTPNSGSWWTTQVSDRLFHPSKQILSTDVMESAVRYQAICWIEWLRNGVGRSIVNSESRMQQQ